MTVYLDRRISGDNSQVSVSYSGGNTTWTLPYQVATDGSEGTLVVRLQSDGSSLAATRPAANQIRVSGDYSATSVWIGVLFQTQFDPTRPYYRDRQGDPVPTGALRLRYIDVLYHESKSFQVEVASAGRYTKTYTFSSDDVLEGSARVPVFANTEDVVLSIIDTSSDPCAFSGLDWEGSLTARSRRI